MAEGKAPIVLIHGLWVALQSWRGWVDRYRAAGHVVHVPAWPDGPDVGIAAAVDHFDGLVRSLPEPPIVMGHSMGGLITQILLDRGLCRAGVAIQPSKPRGVLRVTGSMMRSAWPVVRDPRNRQRAVRITARHFHYVFANTISRAESDRWHARLAAPAPGRPIFEVSFGDLMPTSRAPNVVDFAKQERAPLLLIAGGRDNAMPGSIVYENFNRYRRSAAPTDFKVFRGRPHLMTVLDGWDDVADYALAWTVSHTG
jgi:pimeloyl-ACP methyl ester carboxylesterase